MKQEKISEEAPLKFVVEGDKEAYQEIGTN